MKRCTADKERSRWPIIVGFNGTKYGYVQNLQGDIIQIIDANGAVVVEYTYDAWGKVLNVLYAGIQIFKDACAFLGEINCPLIPEVQLIGNIAQVASFVISITERIGEPFPAYYNSYEIINIQITPER